MTHLIILSVIAVLCFIGAIMVFIKIMRNQNPQATDEQVVIKGNFTKNNVRQIPPYFRKAPLSEPEQVFFHRLKEALPEKILLAQVSMSALLGVRKTGNDSYQTQFNEISRKYVDFVVCNQDFSVVAVIELDDSSHQRGDRIKADVVKDVAFQTINCPLIRFDNRSMPTSVEIRQAVGV